MVELLFDRGGALLAQRLSSDGARMQISGRYRSLIERAFAVGAAGFVLAHNHPSGDPSPSETDLSATRRLSAIAHAVEIEFFDHLIVGGRSVVSLRQAGLMPGRTRL
jgi:DNA repair protein RadC